MIFGFVRKENIFLLQHYHPIRHIHCQIAASEFLTDFDSWDMLTIIGSRSPIPAPFSCPFKLYLFFFKQILTSNKQYSMFHRCPVSQISLVCGKRKPPLLSAVNAGFAAISGKVIYLTAYSEKIQSLNGFSATVHIPAVY